MNRHRRRVQIIDVDRDRREEVHDGQALHGPVAGAVLEDQVVR